ncbi:signal recognition particle-docking protein FtsY [Desulfatirhabdium butyrativorans]|uniref:signal recognition particle-docking protein FtsY n=1 Tax=Desulfatirhabdium butyrativorans TaxID=340467 RepID=UPI00040CEC0B|nr:signal recognition particle-docking protein FtsY [Desulfatirhabdium butyrativorans]
MAFNWFKRKKGQVAAQADEVPGFPQADEAPIEARTPEAEAAGEQADLPLEEAEESHAADPVPDPKAKSGFFQRLRKGLAKTREFLTTDIDQLFSTGRKVDDAVLEELEEKLITADLGVEISMGLIQKISRRKFGQTTTAEELKDILKQEILALFPEMPAGQGREETLSPQTKPHVVLVVGVNGVGKTTTIGKMAAASHREGKKVLIAAGDTFRAAAGEQLDIWAERAGAEIVRHKDNSDPAAVAFDGVDAAVARKIDIVLIDTAGRLHTKVNLMEELKKIKKAVSKRIPDAPHETLLVLDATTGQNALSQAKLFHQAIGVTSIALTKLDGTAKGGIVAGICRETGIPIRYIGVGEKIDDLQPFDPKSFVEALFGPSGAVREPPLP